MKITKEHLIHQGHATFDQIRDMTCLHLTNYNFGLLPADQESQKALDIRILPGHSNTIHVKVLECRAITRGGARIEIVSNGIETENILEASYALENNDQLLLDVIITVNPFTRVPTGPPDPEETPLRHPFTKPEYRLQIVPSDQIRITHLGTYHLTIGKIRVMGNEVKLVEQFIPPCASIQGCQPLESFYLKSYEIIKQLYRNLIYIIKKIKDKSEASSVAEDILEMCNKLAAFLSDNLDELQTLVPHQPPIYMFIFFKRLSRNMVTALNCMSSADREELLKYFADWSGLNPNALENVLQDIQELEYNHADIGNAATVSEKFLLGISSLFERLNQLEYIGRAKETPKAVPKPAAKQSLFINEEPEKNANKKKGLWNF